MDPQWPHARLAAHRPRQRAAAAAARADPSDQLFMLGQAESARTGDHPLPSTERLVALFEVARESEIARTRLDEAASRFPPGDLVADERIFFSVLRGEQLDPVDDVIQPEAPEIVAHHMEARERERGSRLRYAVFGIAAAVALLQPWILDFGKRALDLALIALVSAVAPAAGTPQWLIQAVVFGLMLVALALWLFNMMRTQPQPLVPLRSWRLNVATILDPRIPALLAVLVSPLLLEGLVSRANVVREVRGGDKLIAPLAVLAWVWLVEAERWWSEHRADDFLHVQLQRDWMSGTLRLSAAVMVWVLPWFLTVVPSVAYDGSTAAQVLLAALVAGMASAASNVMWRRWVLGVVETHGLRRVWLDLAWGMLICLVLRAMVLAAQASASMNAVVYVFAIVAVPFAGYYVSLRACCGARADLMAWRPTINATCATMLAVTWFGITYDSLGLDSVVDWMKTRFGWDLTHSRRSGGSCWLCHACWNSYAANTAAHARLWATNARVGDYRHDACVSGRKCIGAAWSQSARSHIGFGSGVWLDKPHRQRPCRCTLAVHASRYSGLLVGVHRGRARSDSGPGGVRASLVARRSRQSLVGHAHHVDGRNRLVVWRSGALLLAACAACGRRLCLEARRARLCRNRGRYAAARRPNRCQSQCGPVPDAGRRVACHCYNVLDAFRCRRSIPPALAAPGDAAVVRGCVHDRTSHDAELRNSKCSRYDRLTPRQP